VGTADRAPDVDVLLSAADRAEADGSLLDSIDALTRANRSLHDTDIERRLVRLRHEAFALVQGRTPPPFPAVPPGPAPTAPGPLELAPEELTAQTLSTGIFNTGAVLVRGLLPEQRVHVLVDAIDRIFDACDAWFADRSTSHAPWYEPFRPDARYANRLGVNRRWTRDGGGVWAADSPRGLFDMLDAIEAAGVDRLIAEYLGERPALSVNKCVLRRVGELDGSDWHQDGAFLGSGIRTVNAWLALSPCGVDAPGLDLVPRRLPILATGTDGAHFDWAVGPGLVEHAALDAPVVRPEAGDVLLFDHHLLHRTAHEPTMTQSRYAIETWFFAPSCYPDGWIPLAI
jgi:hypothetical protein